MEYVKYPDLEHRIEIDEQVPATDQVQAGERRILDDVVPAEYAEVTQVLPYLEAGLRLDEEPFQPLLRHLGPDGGRIHAPAGRFQHLLAQIGGEDLDWKLRHTP